MSGFKVNVNFGSDTFVAKPNFDIREKANLKNIEFFENGKYKPEDYGADGFGEVSVDVQPVLEELTITANGEYTPQEGVDGFSKVVAEFDTSSLPKVKVSSFKVSSACANENGEWDGVALIDTSECTSFERAFSGTNAFINLDLRGLNTSKVKNLQSMFNSSQNLRNINLAGWDTSKVTDCSYAFISSRQLVNLDLSGWDTSNVTTFNAMFCTCTTIESLDLRHFNMGSATNVYIMLSECFALQSLIGGRTIEDVITNNIGCLNGLKVNASMFGSSNLIDRASLRAVINGLADLTGQTAQKLTLGATLMAKLTEEDIAIATNKNWTIA